MSTRLQALIDAVQELSPPEQLELMRALSQSLHRSYQQTLLMVDFWKPKTLDQFLQAQQVLPITDIDELAVEFWPEEGSVDDFIEYIYQQRREDRLRD